MSEALLKVQSFFLSRSMVDEEIALDLESLESGVATLTCTCFNHDVAKI